MEYKLKGDLTLGSFSAINTKRTPKLTIKWKCERKIRHQMTVYKGKTVSMSECDTNHFVGIYKFTGTRFIRA